MRRIISVVLLCLIFLAMLTSCYDYKEVDDLAYVLAIGIDKGVADKWRITIQFPTMKDEGGGGGSGMQATGGSGQIHTGYTYASIDAPSFFTGISMLNTFIPRRISLLHTKIVVISEELARSGQLGEFLAPIVRLRQVRRTVHLAVSKGEALALLKMAKPYIGANLSKNYELQLNESFNTGLYPHITLYDFYNGLKSNYRQPLTLLTGINNSDNFQENGPKWGNKFKTGDGYTAGELPREADNKIDFFGGALFDGDQMVSELTGQELLLALIARGDFNRSYVTIKDPLKPDTIIAIDLRPNGSPKLKVRLVGKKPIINLKIELIGNILSIPSRIGYDENKKLKQRLEKAFSQYIKQGLDKLITKCQTLGVDVLKVGEYVVWDFLTIQEWERYNWLEKFKQADITTEVDFVIKNSGTQIRSAPIIKVEGKK